MLLMRALAIAFSTYSCIPMPPVEWSEENRRYAMCFFPLVGAAVGLVLWLWLWVCDALALGALLKGAVGTALPLVVTGGVHMDGFMDTTDALASCQPRARKLEILKDSHVGAFAVMACCGYLMVMAGLLGEASAADGPCLGLCFVLSRAMSAWTLTAFHGARPDGMLDSFARAAQKKAVTMSSGAYAALCLATWALLGGWTVLLCALVATACILGYRRMAYRQFGGVTGDLAGWFLQVTELACVAAIIMGGKLL